MSAANVARWGYAQTLAGVWDPGEGMQLGLGINDPRGTRFSLGLFGPTTPLLRLCEEAAGLFEASLHATAVERGAPLAVLLASVAPLQLAAPPTLQFFRVLRTAYALGAHEGAAEERTRGDFVAALARRDEAGMGFDLSRVAEQLVDHIAGQPYFSDGEDPRWWEVGLIVLPLPPEPPALELPRVALLFVRTDPAGKALALTTLLTVGDRLVATASRVLARTRDFLHEEDDTDTIEGWT